MKRVEYELVKDGEGWSIAIDGKKTHSYSSLPEAEAAAFDMARTDRDRGFHVHVTMPPHA